MGREAKNLEYLTLESLDRMENSSTREMAVRELRRVVMDWVDVGSYKSFLAQLFSARNRLMWKYLVPLVTDVITKCGTIDYGTTITRQLLVCLRDASTHSAVCHVWTQLSTDQVLNIFQFMAAPGLDASQRSGLGLVLVKAACLAVEWDDQTAIDGLVDGVLHLFTSGASTDIIQDVLLACSALIPMRVSLFQPYTTRLTEECCHVLDGRRTKLGRPLALASCTLLVVIGRVYPPMDLAAYCHRVRSLLSKENLILYALTRCNPKLREAIQLARVAWSSPDAPSPVRSSGTSPQAKSPSRESIYRTAVDESLSHTFVMSPVSVRSPDKKSAHVATDDWIADSPIRATELSFTDHAPVPRDPADIHTILASGTEDDLIDFIIERDSRSVWSAIDRDNVVLLFQVLTELLAEPTITVETHLTILQWVRACSALHGVEDIIPVNEMLRLEYNLHALAERPELGDAPRELLQYFFACE